jgi:snRNA-activating protein complex subunit 3
LQLYDKFLQKYCSFANIHTFYQDTFYNDTRHYSAIDYSKPILDWLNDSSDEVAEKWDAISSGALKKRQKDLLRGLNISNVPEFKSAKMQSTHFSDLHFRIGAGYLYCHQVPIIFSLCLSTVPCS